MQKYAIINDVDLSDPVLSNFNQKQQRENKKTLKIGFLIPGLAKFSGGITSILRLGTILAGLRHQVYYVSLIKDDIPFMKGNAEIGRASCRERV